MIEELIEESKAKLNASRLQVENVCLKKEELVINCNEITKINEVIQEIEDENLSIFPKINDYKRGIDLSKAEFKAKVNESIKTAQSKINELNVQIENLEKSELNKVEIFKKQINTEAIKRIELLKKNNQENSDHIENLNKHLNGLKNELWHEMQRKYNLNLKYREKLNDVESFKNVLNQLKASETDEIKKLKSKFKQFFLM